MEEQNASLEKLISEIDRPFWRASAEARLQELRAEVEALTSGREALLRLHREELERVNLSEDEMEAPENECDCASCDHGRELKALRAEVERLKASVELHGEIATRLQEERDAANLQVGVLREALTKIRHYEFDGDSMSPSGIMADDALKGGIEKPVEAPCKKCWEDINGRWVHAGPCRCECHAEKRIEQSRKEPTNMCHEIVKHDGGPIYCYQPIPCRIHG